MPSEKTVKMIDGVKTTLQNGIFRYFLLLTGIAFSVAVGITLFMSIQEPTYRPLDYQINGKNITAMMDALDKAGIKYKINERDGIVLVPAEDVAKAKLKLSAAGIAKDDEFSYSFLNDQNALGNSQFLENARYIRALENDLEKTISAIEGVSGARVHIAIPRNNVFADENNKVTASVVLSVSPQFMSSKEKVHSIMQIMADSVPGLDPKDVSITDQYGHFLSEGIDSNSMYSAAQLNYQHNIQNYYEKRIESMIVPLLGENKVIVRVNAIIDFTQRENATEEYDPNKVAVLSEQMNSDVSDSGAGASGPPGALSNTPPDDGSKPGQTSNNSGGQKHTQSTKNYNVSKSVTYKKSNVAIVKGLSVAVIVDNEMVLDPKTNKMVSQPLSKEKIDKITELVKTVIGFDAARGDKVTVVNSTYTQIKENVPVSQDKLWETPWFWDIMKKIIGILLGFVFLFVVYRKLIKIMNTPVVIQKKSVFVPDPQDNGEGTLQRMHEIKEDGMNKLKQYALEDPAKIAAIIKNWVGR